MVLFHMHKPALVNEMGSLTSPPAATTLVIDNCAAVQGKGRGLDTVAGTDLARGDFPDAADNIAASSEVELAAMANSNGTDSGAKA